MRHPPQPEMKDIICLFYEDEPSDTPVTVSETNVLYIVMIYIRD